MTLQPKLNDTQKMNVLIILLYYIYIYTSSTHRHEQHFVREKIRRKLDGVDERECRMSRSYLIVFNPVEIGHHQWVRLVAYRGFLFSHFESVFYYFFQNINWNLWNLLRFEFIKWRTKNAFCQFLIFLSFRSKMSGEQAPQLQK